MNVSPERTAYVLALYDLSKADPARWATFMEAFKAYIVFEYERALATPTSEALVTLGMCRRLRDMLTDYQTIETQASNLKR